MDKNEKIERVLQAGKSVQPIEPNPYLFNKVMTRLKNQTDDIYQRHPVLVWTSMSVLTLFIAVNIYIITTAQKNESANEMNSVMNAYGLNEQGGLNYE